VRDLQQLRIVRNDVEDNQIVLLVVGHQWRLNLYKVLFVPLVV